MLKKLANSALVVFGICSFSLPKVLAQSMTNITCSNYWVNPNNGQEQCLNESLQVVRQHSVTIRKFDRHGRNRVHFSPTTFDRHIYSQGSVGRARGNVGNFGSGRSVARSSSNRNTVRVSSGSRTSRVSSGSSGSRVSSGSRGHR